MDKPLVSAIITTYKRDFPMLKQAVESVLNQTYKPLELIVVSDNPPESDFAKSTKEELSAYPSVRFIQLPKNSGAQVARNTGIRAAKGEFTAFLDDDDMWLPQKIEKQMPLFEDEKVGLAYCRGYVINDNNERTAEYANSRWGFHTETNFDEMLVCDYIGSTSQAVVRNACYENCGFFDENLRARQDFDRWLAITSHGWKARGVDEPLFLHRQHAGEQITKNPKVALEANAYVFNKYREGYTRNTEAHVGYYYNRAFVFQGMGNKLGFLANSAHSFMISPKAFLKKYRSYR